ncbi:Clp protease N-terminal domain-containing protein [Streptomyces nondiastaticus]|uniref:Clp protease N-terminal domain-containing protein n=1 Tax=Streptomyces nondiastaticus TaxID=3154512 RepID=UPI0034207812
MNEDLKRIPAQGLELNKKAALPEISLEGVGLDSLSIWSRRSTCPSGSGWRVRPVSVRSTGWSSGGGQTVDARAAGHDCVGTEHIVLGLLSQPVGLAAKFLATETTPEQVCTRWPKPSAQLWRCR